MHYWLLKSEPDTFSWSDQVAKGNDGGIWDGVRNHQAAGFLRAMTPGDRAFFYHTGNERSIVGIVEVTRSHFADPTDPSGRFVAVEVRAKEALPRPVALAELKRDPALEDFLLLRQPRLSVMPVSDRHWRHILKLARRPAHE
ncbi:MAG: EVE domain-containing protein [Pseudomonadales bacterium]|nr:EVE domain-containing protein [Pseudomonadales bacterium]